MSQGPTGAPIVIKNVTGYGVEPCPGCGQKPQPGEVRLTVPGIWLVWHRDCYDPAATDCEWCGNQHIAPFDGRCLI